MSDAIIDYPSHEAIFFTVYVDPLIYLAPLTMHVQTITRRCLRQYRLRSSVRMTYVINS